MKKHNHSQKRSYWWYIVSAAVVVALAVSVVMIHPGVGAGHRSKALKDDYVYVYETEVDGPDDCTSYEEYDEDNGVCYFECETDAECKEIEEAVDEELASWTEDSEDITASDEDVIDSSEPIAQYRITKGEKLSYVEGEDNELYRQLWSEVADLSPNTISNNYVESFELFDEPSSDTLAFVDDNDGNGKWRIAINVPTHEDTDAKEQKSTLIHELAHIISLNSKQVSSAAVCSGYEIPEGCAKSTSYLGAFWKVFWKGNEDQEYNEKSFVSEYASSDPVEDFAESYAWFVLGKGPSALGTSVKDRKVKFFYNYPALVEMRTQMRSVLSRDIVRAKHLVK